MDTYVYMWIWIYIGTQFFINIFLKEKKGREEKRMGIGSGKEGEKEEMSGIKFTPVFLVVISGT